MRYRILSNSDVFDSANSFAWEVYMPICFWKQLVFFSKSKPKFLELGLLTQCLPIPLCLLTMWSWMLWCLKMEQCKLWVRDCCIAFITSFWWNEDCFSRSRNLALLLSHTFFTSCCLFLISLPLYVCVLGETFAHIMDKAMDSLCGKALSRGKGL